MGNKGKKVSTLARLLARSGFQRQRAAILLPRYLVWIKSYLFVYVSLSAVCTPSRRCSERACICAHVFRTYTYPFLSLSLSLSLSLPSLPHFPISLSPFLLFSLSLSLSHYLHLSFGCNDVVVSWAISSRMCIQSLHANGSVSQTLDAGPVS